MKSFLGRLRSSFSFSSSLSPQYFPRRYFSPEFEKTCQAVVYQGSNNGFKVLQVPIPEIIDETDAIVRIDKTTICGTDIHILNGNVSTCTLGRVLGHEGIGNVVKVGKEVSNFKLGDKCIISTITSCGKCKNCMLGFYGHCTNGGWKLGNEINGCQTEYVRIPFVDKSCHKIDELDEKYCMLSDILPTGYETGLIDGNAKEGQTIAIVGVGPVGLAALTSAVGMIDDVTMIAIDINEHRLNIASEIGAKYCISNKNNTAVDEVLKLTDNLGVDLVIECIGTPTGWYICQDIVKAGGRIAILGVHGKPATLNLERMWYKNFTMTAGLVHTNSTQQLKTRVDNKKLDANKLISHKFKMSEIDKAYETFMNAEKYNALKVIIENDLSPPVDEVLKMSQG